VLLADQTAFEDDDLVAARTKGYGFAHIQRYAVEHPPRRPLRLLPHPLAARLPFCPWR
jgi:hypothetical protein